MNVNLMDVFYKLLKVMYDYVEKGETCHNKVTQEQVLDISILLFTRECSCTLLTFRERSSNFFHLVKILYYCPWFFFLVC